MNQSLIDVTGKLIIGAPLFALLFIILDRIIRHEVRELFIKRCLQLSQTVSIVAGLFCSAWVLWYGNSITVLTVKILSLSTQDLTFSLRIDQTSTFFVLMSCILGGVVGLFASRYLHRDSGYFRFFILYHIFLVGIHSIFQGAGLPAIYIGWELIGVTSALLISFFAFRKQTVTNSLRAFWAYRITDSGILIATLIAMHEGIDQFSAETVRQPHLIIVLGCLLSAIGKSAQFPFGHWLPKAMEGPTPSSAIFYGGLSVHAGMYLMLRVSVEYGLPLPAALIMVLIGMITVWYGSVVGRIQSDAKSVLAYASMGQVGLMFIEIGLGLHSLAIFHFLSHAMLRTYQLLNAASLMHDQYAFEHVLGRDQIVFHPVQGDRAFSRYAYAFWESVGGFFGRMSLLVLVEFIARSVRAIEESLSQFIVLVARRTIFFLAHLFRRLTNSVHRSSEGGNAP